ncbi:MAG: Ig-like domain-containing protein [Clostridia bacterium]
MKYITVKKKKKESKNKMKIFVALMIINIIGIDFSAVIGKRYDYQNFPISTISNEFPPSYQPYINKLKADHPNWVFKAVNTGLDWNEAIAHETYELGSNSISTVIDSFSSEWKKDGINNYIDGPYVTASKKAVAYVLDPRNFLNEQGIFQFESLSYSSNTHTLLAVDAVLSNTPMGHSTYKNKYQSGSVGNWIDMGKSYAQIILEKGKKYNVSPIHIASRIKQENSGDIVNGKAINGVYPGYEGYYNFFNIGASPSGSNINNSVLNGMIKAKNSGWDSPEKSIDAGTQKLKRGYIEYGQDTIYFQKFDVNNPYGNAKVLYGSQYMTNILAPKNEALITYNSYKNQGLLGLSYEFHIPVYKTNMPINPSPFPTDPDVSGYFQDDNTWVYLDDTSDINKDDLFNIRSSPDDSTKDNIIANIRETLEGAENRTKFLRIGKGIGLQWDKLLLSDGRVGYIFTGKGYVKEYNYTKVSSISLNKTSVNLQIGATEKLNATINPSNAFIKDVSWSSSDPNVASILNDGTVLAKSNGNCIITVISKDGSKTATCTITVKNKDPDSITLENNEYTILKNTKIKITPKILPENTENKNYSVKVDNTNIVEYQDGTFLGKSAGITKVTFTTQAGTKSVSATITVLDANIQIDESLKIDGNNISSIDPETTVGKMREKIKSTNQIRYINKDGVELKDNELIGTGTKIQIIENGVVKLSFVVVIYGDVNGDGKISAGDYVFIKNHIMNDGGLTGSSLVGADVSKDSKITANDYVKIKNYIMGDTNSIVQ